MSLKKRQKLEMKDAIRLLEYVNKRLDDLIDLMWETLEGDNSERINVWRERVLQMRTKELSVR